MSGLVFWGFVLWGLVVVHAPIARADAPPSTELAAVDEALTLHPDDVTLLLTRAELLLETAQPAPALEDLSLVAALAPTDPRVPSLRARALVALDRADAALAELDRARDGRRAGLEALALRARLLASSGRADEAIEAWDEILSRVDDVDAFAERSALLASVGRLEEALASDREGLARTDAASLRLAVIDRAEQLGLRDVALEALAPWLVPAPGRLRGRWLVRAARLHAAAGRADRARTLYEDAAHELADVAQRRPSAAVLEDLARAELGLGRLDEAEVHARRARAASPRTTSPALLAEIAHARSAASAPRTTGGGR